MKLTLIEKREEVPGVTTFVFEPSEPLAWQAGQFLHYVLPHENADDRGEERWFTVSSAPFEARPQITTRHTDGRSSTFKAALFALPVGSSIEADGPEGDFTVSGAAAELVFIAGGIGITPFRSILKDLDHAGAEIRVALLYANRDENFVFRQELDALAQKHAGFSIQYFTGGKRIGEETIRECVPDLSVPTFYVSGPEPMVKSFEGMLAGMGIPEARIRRDDFPGYEVI